MAAITTLYDILLVAKIRSATFAANEALISAEFTGPVHNTIIQGVSGEARFISLYSTNFKYFLNGQEYPTSNMVAPMNVFGVVHCRWQSGLAFAQDLCFGGTESDIDGSTLEPSELDLGEIIAFDAPQPISLMRELTEHLIIKWGI